MMCTAIHVFMIALMVQSGLAIKCYNCDSDSNPGCEDMSDETLQLEECDGDKQMELEQQFKDHNRHWLLKVSDIYFRRSPKSKSEEVAMVCQKLVGIGEPPQELDNQRRPVDGISPNEVGSQKLTVVRRCQLANVDCAYSNQQLLAQLPKGFRIDFCEPCEDLDGCNGSSSNRVFGLAIGVAVVLTVCRHLSL